MSTGSIEQVDPNPETLALLTQAGLETCDIDSRRSLALFGCSRGGALAGVAGIEQFGQQALLRSLAVSASFQKQGIGRELILHLEDFARSQGVQDIYLLTTTAQRFFEGLGYQTVARHSAPESIQATSQFSGMCPGSAALMSKSL